MPPRRTTVFPSKFLGLAGVCALLGAPACDGDGTQADLPTCPAGQSCQGGACRDNCDGAVCPRGERCQMGACVAIPMEDAGAQPDAARQPVDVPVVDAAVDAPAAEDVKDMDVAADQGPLYLNDSGCNCRTSAPARGGAPWWGVALALAALRRRTRR